MHAWCMHAAVQVVDDASGSGRRPAFKLWVADYKGKAQREPIEFQCDSAEELQAWVSAIEAVIAALRPGGVNLAAQGKMGASSSGLI